MLYTIAETLANVEAWMLALVPVALLTYFTPVLIAYARHHRYGWLIGALNLVIGWTGLGWLACLLWAINRDTRDVPERQPVREHLEFPTLPRRSQQEMRPHAGLTPSLSPERPPVPAPAPVVGQKKCPDCMQPVRSDAVVCRICGHSFRASAARPAPVASVRELERREPRVFPDVGREAAVRSLQHSRLDPRTTPPQHAAFGKNPVQSEDGDWLYDVPGNTGNRRH